MRKRYSNQGGKILCDSSDIRYLYEDEDGALWVDLNTEYFGNFRFQMKYKKEKMKELELIKTVPPNLNQYYKDKVNEYFKQSKGC